VEPSMERSANVDIGMRPLPANARDIAALRNLRVWGSCIRELLGDCGWHGTGTGVWRSDALGHHTSWLPRTDFELYRKLRTGTRSIARGRPKLPEPVPRPDALTRVPTVARAIVERHTRVELTARA